MITWEHPQTLIPKLASPYGPFQSLLDVGGGEGLVGRGHWNIAYVAALDIFEPKNKPENFTLGSALDIVNIYGKKSFDLVMCCEMIEHLTKEDGTKLLSLLEQVATKLVILTTPNGFSEQDPDKYPNEPWANNPYQKHICGWTPEEFRSLGYTVYFNATEDKEAGAQLIVWKQIHD